MGFFVVPTLVISFFGGVFIAYSFNGPNDVSTTKITAICAKHNGVQQISAGLNSASTFVVCRDGVIGKP